MFIDKSVAALAGAESEMAAGRYENVANRCYYACFQAAIAALETAGIRPTGGVKGRWSHEGVQSQFAGILVNRRKRYPSRLGDVLSRVSSTRQRADYSRDRVSEEQARRALRRSREFVETIRNG
ncbi:MAG: HEPN domain-containing protein [Thermomicrobiales bacterium]